MSGTHKLSSIEVDAATLPAATAEIEHQRRVAIFDLIEQNSFTPEGAEGGPYALRLSSQDNRLAFDISGPDFTRTHVLSLSPMKTGTALCEYISRKSLPPSRSNVTRESIPLLSALTRVLSPPQRGSIRRSHCGKKVSDKVWSAAKLKVLARRPCFSPFSSSSM